MVNLPSGMSVADAEALSKQQQEQLRASMPKENELVKMSIGEGAYKYGVQQGNTINWLDTGQFWPSLTGGPRGERDWQGRTIGSWVNSGTSGILGQLGNPSARDINSADFNSLNFSEKNITSEQFLEMAKSGQALGTPLTPISPVVPEKITPEGSIAGIQSVFGAGWQPSPAFTPALQAQGIYGAVRIAGTNEVYTIGSGGRKETAESFLQRFGTSNQEGIVGEVSKEQAIKLGITDTKQTPVAPGTPGAITSDSLANVDKIELPTTNENGTNATTTEAGIKKDVEIYNASKSDREKELEEEVSDITEAMKGLLEDTEGRGAAQLSAEDKEEVAKKQQAEDDAYAEVEIKLAEIETLEADYNLQNQIVEGKPITLARMQGQQAQNYKMFLAQKNLLTSQALLLQAKALALQGKTDRAQAAADKAVELKYADIEQRFNAQSALYDIVKGQLTDEQNIRLEALKAYNDSVKTQLADQKATEKANYSTLLSQMNQYPDAGIQLTDTLEQANAKITANSRIYQQQTRLASTGTGGGGDGTTPEEPLSINQIDQFRRSYGWTPPYGFTQAQLLQFMNDNPNATPEELEAGARQAGGGTAEPITPQTNFPDTVGHVMNTITDEEMDNLFRKAKTAGVTKLLRGKRNDVQAYIETFQSQIEEAINQGYSKEEIKAFILSL